MNDDAKASANDLVKSKLQDVDVSDCSASVKALPIAVKSVALPTNPLLALEKQVAAERIRIANAHRLRLNTRLAAKHVGVCKRTMDSWRKQGKGPPYVQFGAGRKVWYELDDLNRWAASQTCEGDAEQLPPSPEVMDAAGSVSFHPPVGNLTRTAAAHYLEISIRTLDYWRKQPNKPQPMNNGTKRVRYSIADLDAWLKEQTHGG